VNLGEITMMRKNLRRAKTELFSAPSRVAG
jgi:hypothetical protein